MASCDSNVYQLKVSLRGIRPPIWRRLLVRSSTRLDELHEIIQRAMGWENYHLHSFSINNRNYSRRQDDAWGFGGDMGMGDESQVSLSSVVPEAKFKFIYNYDFGDNWDHEILVEKVLPVDKNLVYPCCVKGKRACPPEDCGGCWGYGGEHPEHEERLEWVGGKWDPEYFDIEAVNSRIAGLYNE